MIFTKSYKNNITVSTDQSKFDILKIHSFLKNSYWAKNISYSEVIGRVKNALSFGIYSNNEFTGFARVITDYTSFAYLADVFILENFRGKGYSKILMDSILAHPDLKNIKRIWLQTEDAHSLYAQFDFTLHPNPEIVMMRLK